ncbi:MAG TPA: HDOD domain-containing protein, partial [Chitinivibrionales bacterium]
AYYGFPREISTVNMAIVVLGFNTVKEMGLSLSVFEAFKGAGNDGIFDLSGFWQHSIGCGSAARMIARKFRPQVVGEAFVMGLLHDIGKVIIKQYMREEFAEIIELTAQGIEPLDDIEKRIAGETHAQIGAWLAEKWNLPRLIADAIGFHHAPWDARVDPAIVAIVSLSNYLCHICRIGNSGRVNPIKPDDRTWDIFRAASISIQEADIPNLQTEFLLEFDKTESVISFMNEDI